MPADMHPDVVGRALADHLRPIERIAKNQFGRNDRFPENRALPVDVREEQVERAHPLREPGLELAPLRLRYETRDDVERDQALGGVLVSVDAERDADAAEHVFRLGSPGGKQFRRRFFEPASDLAIKWPCFARRHAHLVERRHAAGPNLIHCSAVRLERRSVLVNRLSQLPCRRRAQAPLRRS